MNHQSVKYFRSTASSTHGRSRRAPSAVADLLESTFKSYHLQKKMRQYSFFTDWPKIVGEDVARICQPEKIVFGRILVVRVLDASWAQELSLQKAAYLARLRALPTGPAIEDIRFVVSGQPSLTRNKNSR